MITGWNADEGSFSPAYGRLSALDFRKQVAERYGKLADQLLTLYPASTDAEAASAQKESARDRQVVSMYVWASHREKLTGSPSYLYYFDHAMPWPEHPEYGAFHTSELIYAFDNLRTLQRPWTP